MTLRILVILTTLSKLQPYQLWLRYFNACCSRNHNKKKIHKKKCWERYVLIIPWQLCCVQSQRILCIHCCCLSLFFTFCLFFLGVCLNVCLDDEWNTLRFDLPLRWQTKKTRKSLKFLLCLCRRLTQIAFQRRQNNYLYWYEERRRERGRDWRANVKNDKSAIWTLNYDNYIFIKNYIINDIVYHSYITYQSTEFLFNRVFKFCETLMILFSYWLHV